MIARIIGAWFGLVVLLAGTPGFAQTFPPSGPLTIQGQAKDPGYGHSEENPIRVGGGIGSGPPNQRAFLDQLAGPNGETIDYHRVGSCCAFATPNGLDGRTGLLDIYAVTWPGRSTPIELYINMYDWDTPLAPVGFTVR
ncbi:MAG: hypothetical protein RLO50_07595 [Azospirillaceae bacterium]